MGVFSRLGTLLKSNINDLISKAENPEKILQQLILDMREQLISAKKQVAIAIADEKKLKKQLDNEMRLKSEWEKKAMMAVRANRDDLAMEALDRQNDHQQLADEYQKQWQLQKQATDKLRASLRQLNEKIDEAKRKKDLLIARQRRAEAQKKIQDTMSGLGDTSAFDAFDRMSDKVDQIEAEAEASAELSADLMDSDLEAQFAGLEQEVGVNDALLALKQKMGVSQPSSRASAEEDEFSFEDVESMEAELADLEEQELKK